MRKVKGGAYWRVIRGLDPRIHASSLTWHWSLDARIKSAHDGAGLAHHGFRAVKLITADIPLCAGPSCISSSSSNMLTSFQPANSAASISHV
jgi:hypothetical protein